MKKLAILATLFALFFNDADLNWTELKKVNFPIIKGKYLVMDKSDQTLYLIENEKIKGKYPAVYGNTSGQKELRGDNKTPEGIYTICYKNSNSEWTLFFGINYPNTRDAREGLEKGIIGREEYELIKQNSCPKKWYTPLGGEIGIHGTSKEYPYLTPITQSSQILKQNWTNGCIGLTNENISSLEKEISIGTKIIIRE